MSKRDFVAIENDVLVIQAKLEVLRTQATQYTALISQLQDMKFSVTEEMQALEQRLRDLEALRIPINWLPNELLGTIFLYCVEQELSSNATSTHPSTDISASLTHVNQRWRAVALSTPRVWSFIHLRGRWNLERVRIFLSRSQSSPLDIHYRSAPNLSLSEERERVSSLIGVLEMEWHRLKRFNVSTKTSEAIAPFIQLFNDTQRTFTNLDAISLSITTPNPQFSAADGLLRNQLSVPQHYKTPIPSWSHLSHLKLEELPLFALPYHFIAKLASLELVYPPKKERPSRAHYFLKMSTFLHFLSLAPLLEELTLNNTIPIFDVTLPDEDQRSDPASNSALLPTPPVKLTRLKAINWTFPLPGDVHQLMSFIDCPALEKLDVWVEAPNPKEEGPWRGHDLSYGTRMKLPMVIDCSPVRDLSFQFSTDDSTVSSLRKLSFPSLESLELMSVDRGTEKDDKTSSRSPTMFPRIESIFHDPRLFCLTNLTLSHFQFNKDHQRPEAILGYIPALISLSLESCLGVENLIKVLEERCTLNLPTMNGVSRAGRVGGVKVCPRLEALSFWGCDDLAIGLLLKIVLTRNGDVSGRNSEPENPSKRIHGGDPHAELGPIGTITGSEHGGKGLNLGASSVAEPALSTASPRKIKPLRKSVHQASASGGRAGSCEVGAGAGRRPSLEAARLVAHEVSQPSPILYIRIHQCPLIHLGDALSLQDLGVTDIVCDGNE